MIKLRRHLGLVLSVLMVISMLPMPSLADSSDDAAFDTETYDIEDAVMINDVTDGLLAEEANGIPVADDPAPTLNLLSSISPMSTSPSAVTLRIGENEPVGYATLREAVAELNTTSSAIEGAAVLQMQTDDSVYIATAEDFLQINTANRVVTLDLNGETLTFVAEGNVSNVYAINVTGANSFKIINGAIELSSFYISISAGASGLNELINVTINSSSSGNILNMGSAIGKGPFSLNNVHITGVNPTNILYCYSTGYSGTITDCSFVCETDADGAKVSNTGIYANGGVLTIENTTVEVFKYAIYTNSSGNVIVNGGNYSGEYAIYGYDQYPTKDSVFNDGVFTGKIHTNSTEYYVAETGYSEIGKDILIRGGYYSDTSTFAGNKKINTVNMRTSPGTDALTGYTQYWLPPAHKASVNLDGADFFELSPSSEAIIDGEVVVYEGCELLWTAKCAEDYEITAATLQISDQISQNIFGSLVKTNDRTWTYTMTNPASDYAIAFTCRPIAADTVIAKIDDTEYTSLSTLVMELNDSGTITLLSDITRATDLTLPDGDYILDLNGHRLTLNEENTGTYGLTLGAGSFEIRDSTKSGDSPGNGVIDFSGQRSGIYISKDNTTLTLNGGTITGVPPGNTSYYAVYLYGYVAAGCNVTVDGAYVKGAVYAYANSRTPYNRLEMKSGTVENAGYALAVQTGTEFSMTGGRLIMPAANAESTSYSILMYGNLPVSITGGEIINETSYPVYVSQSASGTASVTIGGSVKITGKKTAAVGITTRSSGATQPTVNIEGAAVLDGATNAVDIIPYGSRATFPKVNITGGYFKYGEEYLPVSDTAYVVAYPDGEVIDIDPIDDADIVQNATLAGYAGYHRFVDTDDLAYTQTVGEEVYNYTYQEFEGTAMAPGGLKLAIETAKAIKDIGNIKDADTGNTKYPGSTWTAFETAYAAALRCYDPYADTHNAKANQAEIDYRGRTLNWAMADLDASLAVSDLTKLPQGDYSVQVEMLHYSGVGASMMSKCVQPDARLTVTAEGEFKLQVDVQPIVASYLWGHPIGYWVYQGATPDEAYRNMTLENESARTEAAYLNRYNHTPVDLLDYTLTYTDEGQFPGTFEFTLPYVGSSAEYSEMFCYVAVDAMQLIGIGDKPVRLRIKYGTLKAISTEATLRLNTDAVSLIAGGNQTVNAELIAADGYTVSWSSGNTAVATVAPAAGLSATIKAEGAGTCTVTATAKMSGMPDITKSIAVTVATASETAVQVENVQVGSDGVVTATITGDVLVTNGSGDGVETANNSVVTIDVTSDPADNPAGVEITAANVIIPASVASALTGKDVTVKTDMGDIKLNSAAVTQIAAGLTSGDATLTVSDAAKPSGLDGTYAGFYDISLTNVSGATVAFNNGTATISVPCGDPSVKFAYHIANGKRVERQGVMYANGAATWTTNHFSLWALSTNEYEIGDTSGGNQGTNPGATDPGGFFLSDGNYYVNIALWHATESRESMGDVAFNNNRRALVTVANGRITTVRIATNPVDVGEIRSAIIDFRVPGSNVRVLETEPFTTAPANKNYNYIKLVEFAMPTSGQPSVRSEITYAEVGFTVPDTPMDDVVDGPLTARLRFVWSSATATGDTSLTADTSVASGTSSLDTANAPAASFTDSATGIKLTASEGVIPTDAELTVKAITSGTDFTKAEAALKEVLATAETPKFKLYDISLIQSKVAIQPDGTVTISVPIPSDYDKAKVLVYRINDDGTATLIKGKVSGSNYEVGLSHLSLYALVEGEDVINDLTTPLSASAFTDITGHWAYDAIVFAVENGLFNGTSETTFSPNAFMNRGMFVTVLGRMEGIDVNSYVTAAFSDTAAGSYYTPYATWASANGIASGVGGSLFAPAQEITRQEMAAMLNNYVKFKGISLSSDAQVTFADDAAIASWAKDGVYALAFAGVLNGVGDDLYAPAKTATRAEVATMLMRFVQGYGS
ncbi:MAG: S-layer homology domain-containing protein [Clostridiales Family XIII bacterium]|nr:S-layer homology domain-containing protein [Clostridiales Family XIII bacterium]